MFIWHLILSECGLHFPVDFSLRGVTSVTSRTFPVYGSSPYLQVCYSTPDLSYIRQPSAFMYSLCTNYIISSLVCGADVTLYCECLWRHIVYISVCVCVSCMCPCCGNYLCFHGYCLLWKIVMLEILSVCSSQFICTKIHIHWLYTEYLQSTYKYEQMFQINLDTSGNLSGSRYYFWLSKIRIFTFVYWYFWFFFSTSQWFSGSGSQWCYVFFSRTRKYKDVWVVDKEKPPWMSHLFFTGKCILSEARVLHQLLWRSLLDWLQTGLTFPPKSLETKIWRLKWLLTFAKQMNWQKVFI